MDEKEFNEQINGTRNFYLRRAVERLREGLFDPLGVQWLTSGEEKLNQLFDRGAAALDKGMSYHLCVCGAYGQGKSHSLTYLKQRALKNNFVVSYINLDPRQIPFHDFKDVYRALMGAMVFPNEKNNLIKVWKESAAQWLARPENKEKSISDFIPGNMPHRFRAILAAMAHKNMDIPVNKRNLKKHARFQPRSFAWTLKNALMGKDIPAHKLAAAFHYREVPFYKNTSLVCREAKEYLAMVKGLAQLLKEMGYGGWVLLFDEGESIGQTRITSRSKSYDLLHEIFCPERPAQGFYPVFAFTHDFFTLVESEPWDRTRRPGGRRKSDQPTYDIPCFARNFHKAWKKINIHSLQDLSPGEWETLSGKLKILHGRAYGWEPGTPELTRKMKQILNFRPGGAAISAGADREDRQIQARLLHLIKEDTELPALLNDLYREWAYRKILVFCNSRSACDRLSGIVRRNGVFRDVTELHYSNLKAKERKKAEDRFRKNPHALCIATSTLELGIDVGDVDAVLLYQPPGSVSAFLQRIGRSNRRGQSINFWGITAGESAGNQVIRFLALLELGRQGKIEAPIPKTLPSVLSQQVISCLYEKKELSLNALKVLFPDRKSLLPDIFKSLEKKGWLRRTKRPGLLRGGWQYRNHFMEYKIWGNFPENEKEYILEVNMESIADIPQSIVDQMEVGDRVYLSGRRLKILKI